MERDRDAAGRARNARPRDELGRPLPYDASGVPRAPEGIRRSPDETIVAAQEALDAGRPFHAHEVFEDAWKSARGDDTEWLWKALAQLAVAETHRLRGNATGAQRLRRRAATALIAYVDAAPYGLDVSRLQAWAAAADDDITPLPRLRASGQSLSGAEDR